MSLLKSNGVQFGQSGTATNNLTLSVPASPDGTIKLARGNSGATTADILSVDSSGNVGIGTASPIRKLSVEGGGIGFQDAGGSTSRAISWIDSTTSNSPLQILGNSTTGNCYLSVLTNTFGSAATERLRIDSSGNIGIGTTSPSAPLHIRGAAGRFAFPATSGATQSNGLTLRLNDASDDNAILDIGGNSTSGYWLQATNNANLATNYPLLLNPNGGYVGIGTTSPNARLFVRTGESPNNAQLLIGYLNGSENYYDANTHYFRNGSAAETMRINSSGVTIATLAGTGSRSVNASAAGLLSAASDASLKEEVVGAHIAGLAEILQIHPKMYRWKDDIANRGDEASVELGFIANDVAPIIPSAAPMGNDGLYGFYDRSVIAALVKAVQELSAKVTALEAA